MRVQARQLRQKLRDHYDLQGRDRRVRIDLPKGGYVPQFRNEPLAESSADAARIPGPAPSSVEGPRRSAAVRVATVAALATLAVVVASSELYAAPGSMCQRHLCLGRLPSCRSGISPAMSLRILQRRSHGKPDYRVVNARRVASGVSRLRVRFQGEGDRSARGWPRPSHRHDRRGSVRKNGDAVRVDVRLVDAVSGGVVWAGESSGRHPTCSSWKTRSRALSPPRSPDTRARCPPPWIAAPPIWRPTART